MLYLFLYILNFLKPFNTVGDLPQKAEEILIKRNSKHRKCFNGRKVDRLKEEKNIRQFILV